jgi:hypothetical protein
MTWEKLTGTPVEVRSIASYQTREGSLLVSLEIVPRDGKPQHIMLSMPTVKRVAEALDDILIQIHERTESN